MKAAPQLLTLEFALVNGPHQALPQTSDRHSTESAPTLLRFSLRQVLWGFVLVALFCTLLTVTRGLWPMMIAMATLLVLAHLFSTLIGHRLRDGKHQKNRRSGESNAAVVASAKHLLPEATSLARQESVLPWSRLVVATGAMLGAGFGAWVIGLVPGEVTWAGLLLGSVSCGVVGAWMFWLGYCFSSIARQAWRHAGTPASSTPFPSSPSQSSQENP